MSFPVTFSSLYGVNNFFVLLVDYSILFMISNICQRHGARMLTSIVGVCQMTVNDSKEENFNQAQELVKECRRRGALMAFLPEACDYIASNSDSTVAMADSCSENANSILSKYCTLAKETDLWLSLGGMHRICVGDPKEKIRNSHIIVDNNGNIQGIYDKCHLYDVDIPSKVTLKETDRTVPGNKILEPVRTPIGNIGAMVCYDVRFPQISTKLREQGADILTYPSAFTVPTGLAHWEVLMRARAIENQCYVISAAQIGKHNSKRTSFGHSLVVNPWGIVVARASDKIGVITAEIDLQYLQKIRAEMPVINHARKDLY